jgi:phosphonopyruvate decarboxylase
VPSLNPVDLRDALISRGVEWFTGVPCSFFGGLIQSVGKDCYIPAANEGAALATACGIALSGKRGVVMIQNSGLGNMVNPLTSLSAVYELGVLLLISHRGDPRGAPDEPQHQLMGEITEPLLEVLRIPQWRLPRTHDEVGPVLDAAMTEISSGRSAAILVGKGVIGPASPDASSDSLRPSPEAAFRVIADLISDELIIATTGYTSRRLFAEHDRPGNFYMQGSMGHAASIGLGMALANQRSRVVVLDGDGACLMHLGVLGSVGQLAPANYIQIVLDNGRYESTGGQSVASIRYEDAALAAGYRRVARARTLDEVATELDRMLSDSGPAMLVVEVGAGGSVPPRATATLSALEIRSRFSAHSRFAERMHL